MTHVRMFIAICGMRAHSAATANSFTPWFKLIARDFLFGWWDILMERQGFDGRVYAKTLTGVADGSKVIKMM